MKTKKILCLVIAVVMVALACPLSAFAGEPAAKVSGVQSTATSDAQITTGVASIWYTKDGADTKHADYNSLDAAFEGLRDLYVGPLADATIVDGDDEDTTLSNELYAAAGSPVIKLNGNFQGTYTRPNWATMDGNNKIPYDKNKVVTIVVDGAKSATENYTITFGTDAAPFNETAFNHLAYYNLTIKNTNIVVNRGGSTLDNNFCWQGNSGLADPGTSYTIFENCYINQISTLSNSDQGCLFKMNGKAKADKNANYVDPYADDKYNLILRDTTVEVGTAIVLQVHWGADANIELYNSTMALTGTAGKSNNNDAILKYYEAGDGKIYIDGTSKLISKRGTGCGTTALIRNIGSQAYPVDIILEQGAELRMENTGALETTTYLALDGQKDKLVDNGAIYYASANDVKNGVTLPAYFKDDAGVSHIWKANGTLATNPYKNASATADVTFTHGVADDSVYDQTDASVAYIERTGGKKLYFNSLAEAVEHLDVLYKAVTTANLTDDALWQAAGSPVIVLYKDITIENTIAPSWWSKNYDQNRVRTVVIKGIKDDNTQALITSNVAGAAFRYNAYYNLTLENINLTCTQGFAIFWSGYNGGQNSGKSTTTMKDCYIKATGTTGEGLVFKVTGNQKADSKTENYIINFINTDVMATAGSTSTAEDSDGVNAVFLFHHGCAGTVNIDGESTIKHYNKRNTAGGDTMFMLGSNRQMVINVESGAYLYGRAQNVCSTGAYKDTYAMFRLEGSDNYPSADGIKNVLNIKSGAKIELDTNGSLFTGNVYFIWNGLTDTTKTVYNISNKAEVKFTQKAAALGGGYLGGGADYCGGLAIGYTFTELKDGGETKTSLNAVFGKDKYDDAITITPIVINPEEMFKTTAGAAVMMKDGKYAIRFETTVDKALLESFTDDFTLTFGTNVVLKDIMSDDLSPIPDRTYVGGTIGADLVSTQTKWIETEDGYVYYTTLAGIDATASNLITELAFCSYFKIKNPDGTTKTIYAEYDENLHVRSLYEVATNLEAAGNGNETTKAIIETVNAATK